ERKARVVVRSTLRGARVVELLEDTGAIYQPTEVAVSHGRRRHLHQLAGILAQGEALISEEEECLVLAVVKLRDQYRAAHRSSKFVADQVRRGEVGRILTRLGDTEIIVPSG